MHATLKRYIRSPKKSLDKMVDYLDRMVIAQVAEIKKSFQDSLMVVKNHHKIPLFDNLRGKVSHLAIEHIILELDKAYELQGSGGVCGCQIYKSCGLPCACRVIEYKTKGVKIPLEDIDQFWTKLDFEPLTPAGPVDLEENLVNIYDYIDQQSPIVQKSILSKIKSVLFPSISNKKPPVVQKQTRGRPTVKRQQQKEAEATRNSSYTPEPARNSSYTPEPPRNSSFTAGSEQSRHDPPRHSSYIPSGNTVKTTSTQTTKKASSRRSRLSTQNSTDGGDDHGFILLKDPEYLPVIHRYKNEIPPLFQPYISRLVDVHPDGNCGFRAVAQCLYFNQWSWPQVRKDLLEEMDGHKEQWERIFEYINPGEYKRLRDTIDWPHIEACKRTHWMLMPYTGLLIAERYHVVLHLLSVRGSATFFPLFIGPTDTLHCPEITIIYVTNHFLSATLEGDYPVPAPEGHWDIFHDEVASAWEVKYRDRMNRFIDIMNPGRDEPPEVIPIPSQN